MGGGWFEKEHVGLRPAVPGREGPPGHPGGLAGDLHAALVRRRRPQLRGPESSASRTRPGYPKPAQRPHPPIIIGGGGAKRTPRLAAQFADEFNVFGGLKTFNTRKRAPPGRVQGHRARSVHAQADLGRPDRRRHRRGRPQAPASDPPRSNNEKDNVRRVDRHHAAATAGWSGRSIRWPSR